MIFVSVSSTLSQLDGEWAVAKPIDRRRLSDVLRSAIQAKRSRVLVVARDAVRIALAPALAGLGVECRWVSTVRGAAGVGAEQHFEVALVHASMSESVELLGSSLRGRRGERSLILFSTGSDAAGLGDGIGMPVFPLAQAINALRVTLVGETAAASGR